jgi:hypothetical protein
VKFDLQSDLEELQARIYLETKKKLTKKDILEMTFKIGAKNYNQLINEIERKNQSISSEAIEDLLQQTFDFGEGTENLSEEVDLTLYQKQRGK